jgi:hypothetical protein
MEDPWTERTDTFILAGPERCKFRLSTKPRDGVTWQYGHERFVTRTDWRYLTLAVGIRVRSLLW